MEADHGFEYSTHDALLKQYPIETAEPDGTLGYVGSTYSADNDTVADGISRPGARVVTFAPLLKYKLFPLPEILDLLLDMGTWGMGTPIEIEFAVDMATGKNKPMEFGLLQMRPLVINRESDNFNIEEIDKDRIICSSNQVLGNGIIDDIHDIVLVDPDTFDRAKSREVAREVSLFNAALMEKNRPYLLIGMGRWGTLDPWLGIPVKWEQIAGAKTIVESGFKEFSVAPSQGSHFFQNITSFMVGYFTIDSHKQEGFIDWEWLQKLKTDEKKFFTKLLHFEKPIIVKMNRHKNKGIILKPGN
jgi:hypothetical protein